MKTEPIYPKKSIIRDFKDGAHAVQAGIGKLFPGPTSAMKTGLNVAGHPVLFVHNPRTGGRSLKRLFQTKRVSHAYPSEKLTEKQWNAHFIVCAIRHPLDRFVSAYTSIQREEKGGLIKRFGQEVRLISPLQYIDLIRRFPRNGGPQVQWAKFPSRQKPVADLLMRFEEIQGWGDILRESGMDLQGRTIPHVGRSDSTGRSHQERLDLNSKEFKIVEDAVKEFFAEDYNEFGYR